MDPKAEEKVAPKKSTFKEIVSIIVISLAIVLPIRAFVAQPFLVSGASMDNTFQNGNYLIVDELSYRFEEPKRGDVIIFKVPIAGLEAQHVSTNQTVYYIKRIIGLPGETVEINGDEVKISTGSSTPETLNEPYAYFDKNSGNYFLNLKEKVTLGANEYFVMGDNRHNSSDSRIWGTLPKENIKGRAIFRLLPPTEIGIFPGEYR